MLSERDSGFWDSVSGTYTPGRQGDAPERIVDRLFETESILPSDCVMEVGCGPGTYSLLLAPRVRILVCMDTSDVMLDRLFASAGESGYTNIERFHKDWTTYTPRKGYDFCFASLLPGSDTEGSMERMEGTARRGCAVLAWERLHDDDLTDRVSEMLGIERTKPRRGTGFFEDWLSERGRDFAVERFEIPFDDSFPIEKVVRAESIKFGAYGVETDVSDAVREAVADRTENGIVRSSGTNVLRMVRWKV